MEPTNPSIDQSALELAIRQRDEALARADSLQRQLLRARSDLLEAKALLGEVAQLSRHSKYWRMPWALMDRIHRFTGRM